MTTASANLTSDMSSDLAAIISAPEKVLRTAVRALCRDSDIKSRLASLIKQLQDESRSGENLKRKADDSGPQVCIKCEEVFYEEDNVHRWCRYHYGKQGRETCLANETTNSIIQAN